MFSVVVPLVSMAAFASPFSFPVHFEDEVCGKVYSTVLDRTKIPLAPTWNEDQDEHPPLSARKAVALTKKVRDSAIDIPNDFKWETANVCLMRIGDSWIWSVLYRAVRKEGDGIFDKPNGLSMVVFMDGTVLKPVFKRNVEKEAAE